MNLTKNKWYLITNTRGDSEKMRFMLMTTVEARNKGDVAFYQEMKAAVKNKEYKKSLQVLFMAIDVINKAEGK